MIQRPCAKVFAHRALWPAAVLFSVSALLSACGGGGGSDGSALEQSASGSNATPVVNSCEGQCADPGVSLSTEDVRRVLAQGIAEASALGVQATIAVVDRVGNVLAVHRMSPNGLAVRITTGGEPPISGGLEGIVLPEGSAGDGVAAIAKAVTGAYLSSEGNAFSTRTANQIVQEHFNPGEFNQPSGPLFGVQFSQLACSDFTLTGDPLRSTVGPQRSPLGLAADPGGFPLYKDGTPVGGVGVMADGEYGIDRNILDVDTDLDEQIALAATFGFAAPIDRRAERITVEGKTLRFSDISVEQLATNPGSAPAYDTLQGQGFLLDVPGYGGGRILPGTRFGQPESGIVPLASTRIVDAFGFVDANGELRFAPREGTDAGLLDAAALSAAEVDELLFSALDVARRSRAQIRRPLGTPARVTISVVDTRGQVLGMLRTRDAPVFGADVSLQKARTAALFSARDAGAFLESITEPARYLSPSLAVVEEIRIPSYVEAARAFMGAQALADGIAFSDRAGGNLSRPFYPDGIRGNPHGPFSKSFADNRWSVLSTGLQLDLVINRLLAHAVFAAGAAAEDVGDNCVAEPSGRIAGGIQIFPGSVPIYRGDTLVGGIGVSGDGIDQDDMIAFLGLHEAGLALDGSINNAPPAIRADQLTPAGQRLRYIQCPQTPFIGSDAQQVCEGK